MECTSGHRVEGKIELIIPSELEASLAEKVITILSTRQTLRQISSVSGNLVGNNAPLDIVTVGNPRCAFGVT